MAHDSAAGQQFTLHQESLDGLGSQPVGNFIGMMIGRMNPKLSLVAATKGFQQVQHRY